VQPMQLGLGITSVTKHQLWQQLAGIKDDMAACLDQVYQQAQTKYFPSSDNATSSRTLDLIVYGHSQGGGSAVASHMYFQASDSTLSSKYNLKATVASAGIYDAGVWKSSLLSSYADYSTDAIITASVAADLLPVSKKMQHVTLATMLYTYKVSNGAAAVDIEYEAAYPADASGTGDDWSQVKLVSDLASADQAAVVASPVENITGYDTKPPFLTVASWNKILDTTSALRQGLDAYIMANSHTSEFATAFTNNQVPMKVFFACNDLSILCAHGKAIPAASGIIHIDLTPTGADRTLAITKIAERHELSFTQSWVEFAKIARGLGVAGGSPVAAAAGWIKGDGDKSCTDECASKGLECNAESISMMTDITGKLAMQGILPDITPTTTCADYQGDTGADAPFITASTNVSANNVCYYQKNAKFAVSTGGNGTGEKAGMAAGDTVTCAAIDLSGQSQDPVVTRKRLCYCAVAGGTPGVGASGSDTVENTTGTPTDRPLTDMSGDKSRTVLTVFITGQDGRNLVLNPDGTLKFAFTTGQRARWNLLDSGDGVGTIHVQSASRTINTFLYDDGTGLSMSPAPDTWTLQGDGNGGMKMKSAVNGNYLRNTDGMLWKGTDGNVLGCATFCAFSIKLNAIGWGASPTQIAASPTSLSVYLQGTHGKNLMISRSTGALTLDGGYVQNAKWRLSPSGDGRALLKSKTNKYLSDKDGTLQLRAWDPIIPDPSMSWWSIVEQATGKMTFESNRGQFLVDICKENRICTGEAGLSDGAGRYNVGNARKFNVILESVNFQVVTR